MPATIEKINKVEYAAWEHSLDPTHESTEPAVAAHCPACAMVDELIQELIRKQLREAPRC